MDPLVSVILSFHNDEKYLKKAILSILAQSYTNFELLIMDDASTDASWEVLNLFNDDRIKAFRSKENLGLAAAMNQLILKAGGKYIARMDADDISMPDRLAIQVAEMEKDPKLILLGSFAITIDENENEKGIWSFPIRDEQIKSKLIFSTAFIHPSVMIRTASLMQHNIRYDDQIRYAQDRDLWLRLIPYGKFKNLTTPLIYYRRHSHQVTISRKGKQNELNARLTLNYWRGLGIFIPDEDAALVEQITKGYQLSIKRNCLNKVNTYLNQLSKKIEQHPHLSGQEYEVLWKQYWAIIGSESTNLSLAYFWVWLSQSSTKKISLIVIGKCFIKSLLKSITHLKI